MEIAISLSALTPSQYRPYVKDWKPNKALLKIFEKISGRTGRKAMRIYFDVGHNVIRNADTVSSAPKAIGDFLAEKKITILDYFAGVGRDSHGRTVRLGKALAKEAELKKMFDSDPDRKVVAQETKAGRMVCISMHPYDIAGMSTDRGWTSCMDLVNGVNKRYIKTETKTGTLIAYLIDAQDKNINKPVARCLLKPYFDMDDSRPSVGKKGITAVYLADRAYPDKNATFVLQVQDWVDQNINKDLALGKTSLNMMLPEKLYDDMNREVVRYDATKTTAENNEKSYTELRMRQEIRNDPAGYAQKISDGEYTDHLGRTMANMAKDSMSFVLKLLDSGWGGNDFIDRVNTVMSYEGIDDNLSVLTSAQKQYVRYAADTFSPDKVLRLAKASSRNPNIALALLNASDSEDEDLIAETIDSIQMYTGEDMVEGGHENALSEIWEKARRIGDSDGVFWRQASYIGYNARTVGAVQDQEYSKSGKEDLVAAIVSLYFGLKKHSDISALTERSLLQCEDLVRDRYLDLALKIFEGATPLKIEFGYRFASNISLNLHGFDRKTLKRAKELSSDMRKGISPVVLYNSNVFEDLGLTYLGPIVGSEDFAAFYVKENIPVEEYGPTIRAIEKALILDYLKRQP